MAAKKNTIPKEVTATEAPKAEKELSKKDKIKQALAGINSKLGANTVGTLTQKIKDFEIIQHATKCMAFNQMLHGGLVEGGIIEFYGPPDSGKTSMALDFLGYMMNNDPDFTAAWYETEGLFDSDFAINTFGIDPERLTAYETLETGGAEKGLDVFESLIRSGLYNCIVCNTVAGLTPKVELEGNMEDQQVAAQARMMSKLMRKIVAVARKRHCMVIFINQVRTNVGGYKGGDISVGGQALRFFASQRVNFRGGFIEAEDKTKGYDPELFKKIDCSTKKNRLNHGKNPYQKCTYFVEYGVGIDMVGELPDIVIDLGILVKNGNYFVEPSGKVDAKGKVIPKLAADGSKIQWNGAGAFRKHLREHPEYVDDLRKRIEAVGGSVQTTVQSMTDEEIDGAKQEDAEALEFLKESKADISEADLSEV